LTVDDKKELVKQLETIVSQQPQSEQRLQVKEFVKQNVLERFEGKVCAVFTTLAEPKRAKQKTQERCACVLDLLRYAIPALYPRSAEVRVGFDGELWRFASPIPIVSSDNSQFSIQWLEMGPVFPMEISQETIQSLEEIGVLRLGKALEKQACQRSEFETVLLRGVHWFANAQLPLEKATQFLSLVTCLESFLCPKDRDPISTSVAEGVALVLGENLDNRRRLKRKVKELYGIRSAITHSGLETVLDVDLETLRNIALALTSALIKRADDFSKQQDLLDWIEDKKLS